MKESFKAKLKVNKVSIELKPFVEQFLARIMYGAVSSLKEAEDIQDIELYLEHDDVDIIVNGKELILTPFPKDIISNTLVGLVSSLKGISKIDSLNISIKAQ